MSQPDEGPRDIGPPGVRTGGPVDPGGRLALGVAAAGLLTALFYAPLGLALTVVALVLAVRARRRARRAGGTAPGSGLALGIGIAGAVITALLLVTIVVLYDEVTTWTECMQGANTEVAKSDCRDELESALRRRFG